MTCSELTHCWALFSTSHHVRVNLCSIPMFNFLKTQMILPVRTGATVHVCKFLQCHHFGNSRRKLVSLEGSKVQHQVLIGASLVGKDSIVPGVRSSAGLCICVPAASHLLPFSSFWEREKSWNLFWGSHHVLTWTSQEQDKDLSFQHGELSMAKHATGFFAVVVFLFFLVFFLFFLISPFYIFTLLDNTKFLT